MTNGTTAERIAESTWHRIGKSWRLRTRLGEETLTDLLVLDFLASAWGYNVKVLQTTKPQEAQQGTDLEIRVRHGERDAYVYAIQAKKLYKKGYNHLHVRSSRKQSFQIDILENYAKRSGAIPLYLLFNHVDHSSANSRYWHCCQQSIDERQFGCTLVPSWQIRRVIGMYGCRTFKDIHLDPAALPWRCAFDCQKSPRPWEQIRKKSEESHQQFISEASPSFRSRYEGITFDHVQEAWPVNLWDDEISSLSDRDTTLLYRTAALETLPEYEKAETDEFDPHHRVAVGSSRRLFLPRWLILVNNENS